MQISDNRNMSLILPKFNYEDLEFDHDFSYPNQDPFKYQTIYASIPGDKNSYAGYDHHETGKPVQRNVGHMKWETATGDLHYVETHPEYKRRGIATHMLRKAREVQAAHGLPDIRHTGVRYPEGTAWAKSTGLYVPPISSGVCRECNRLRAVSGACKCTPNYEPL